MQAILHFIILIEHIKYAIKSFIRELILWYEVENIPY